MGTRKIAGTNVFFAVVCDGVGSLADGAFASSYAVKTLIKWFERQSDTRTAADSLAAEIDEINRYVYQQARQVNLQTGTTLSALLLMNEKYHIIHLGDSRIYGAFDGVFRQLTLDHVAGIGNEKPNALTVCLGAFESVGVFRNEGAFESGSVFVLCSDGFYKKFDFSDWPSEISEANSKRSLEKILDGLADYVISQGENDNISLAVVKTMRR